MIENIIEQIKASENKSKEIIQVAKKQYNEIIEKAYCKSSEIEKQTLAEITGMLKDSEEKAVSDSKAETGRFKEDYEKKNSCVFNYFIAYI